MEMVSSIKEFSHLLRLSPHSSNGYLGVGDIIFGEQEEVQPHLLFPPPYPPSSVSSPILKHFVTFNAATQDNNQ